MQTKLFNLLDFTKDRIEIQTVAIFLKWICFTCKHYSNIYTRSEI